MEPRLFPIVFWCNAPEAGLIGAVSLFKFRRIKHLSLRRSQSSLCAARCHLMSGFEKKVSLTGTEGSNPSPLTGDRGFESFSLQERVTCEPGDQDRRREG